MSGLFSHGHGFRNGPSMTVRGTTALLSEGNLNYCITNPESIHETNLPSNALNQDLFLWPKNQILNVDAHFALTIPSTKDHQPKTNNRSRSTKDHQPKTANKVFGGRFVHFRIPVSQDTLISYSPFGYLAPSITEMSYEMRGKA